MLGHADDALLHLLLGLLLVAGPQHVDKERLCPGHLRLHRGIRPSLLEGGVFQKPHVLRHHAVLNHGILRSREERVQHGVDAGAEVVCGLPQHVLPTALLCQCRLP